MPRTLVALAVLSLVACSQATEEPAPAPEVGGAAAPAPGPSPAPSFTPDRAEVSDPPAPVMSQTFEDASPECNDWAAEGATSIRSIPPHSGDYACKLCATAELGSFSLARAVGPLASGRYVLSAWIRTRPSTPVPDVVRAVLAAETPAGPREASSPDVTLVDDYARVDVSLELRDGARSVEARIEAPSDGAQPCLLVDDVALTRAGD
jgi:hypothetical protein